MLSTMRIELALPDGTEAAITIDDNDGSTYVHAKNVDLIRLGESANEAAAGPPLWAGPLEAVRGWLAERPDIQATEIGVPDLPNEPDRVY